MGKRVVLLVTLVALVAGGCGSMTGSASPTPLYAPDDLAFQLPRSVAGIALEVEGGAGTEYSTDLFGTDFLRELLLPFGREPSDVRAASAKSGLNERDQTRLSVAALRVEGVAAEVLVMPFLDSMLLPGEATLPPTLPPPYSMTWQQVSGRRVIVLGDDNEGWLLLYPKGEVLFMATTSLDDPEVTIEDVLAELP